MFSAGEAYSAVERASPKSPPCFPISQILDQLLLVLRTKITASMRTTSYLQHLKDATQQRRIPEWLIANRFGHWQIIHIPLQRKQPFKENAAWRFQEAKLGCLAKSQLFRSQTSNILQGRHIYGSDQKLSAIPK